ncbi:MAG: Stk1 family PASTA domain-containing Ser/Thr kinase [Propionibacteriaceae bacterium]|jgi:serine/threonine-protein kinase|nr:Stk1 family PASTA domain-containing Ser/Thr kinase [Propionibacteriaceae bacterium]
MSDEPRLLGGRYLLGALLGRGGMAEVRKALDTRLNREVAIKQLRIDLASDQTFQERFRREAQSAAGLNHPNIVAVYDTGEEVDPATGVAVPYIVMELVHGHTLRELLRTGRKIQPNKALEFTAGVLDALSYSHKAGIVHRDIKPANVMLTPSGQVKVMDFGIARAVADTSSTMTQTAAVIGTASYFSPEQARGEAVDARSDIYSTGCLLYELLTGRPPFVGDSPVSVAYQHVQEPPVPPSRLDPVVTPSMDAVVMRSLAKDPDTRYQTAAAMRADITRILSGMDVRQPQVPTTPIPTLPTQPATTVIPEVHVPATVAAPLAAATVGNVAQPPATAVAAPAHSDPEPPRRFIGLWIFLGLLVAIGAGLTIWLVWFNNPTPEVEYVTVPNVTDRKAEEAEATLREYGLVPTMATMNGPDDDTLDRVVEQNPKANIEVPAGTEVTYTVNIGSNKITIPSDLVGQKCEDVVNDLHAMGFPIPTLMTDTEEPVTAKADTVTRTNPVGGASVADSTQIEVYCATGKSKVPNLMGMTQEQAEQALKDNGFTKYKFVELESTATEGTVVKQSPAFGEEVKRTKQITVSLAIPPPEPTYTPTPTSSPTPTDTETPTPDTPI